MAKNIVYFDLETQRSAAEVGGWQNAHKMGISVGVTFSTEKNAYSIYLEQDADALINELRRADLVVGFNIVRFDYSVLSAYSVFDFSQVPTLDLLVSIEGSIGRRLPLDAIAEASLGVNKTAVGTDALKWWKEGRLHDIAEYCCYDVKVTRLVHEYGVEEGKVFYVDTRTHLKNEITVDWKLS